MLQTQHAHRTTPRKLGGACNVADALRTSIMVSITTAATVCASLASITVAPISRPRLCATCAKTRAHGERLHESGSLLTSAYTF